MIPFRVVSLSVRGVHLWHNRDHCIGGRNTGEVESDYDSILNSTAIPTWPVVSPDRWNVLLDSFIVSTTTVQVTTNVTGAPDNKAVVSLDSGTSYT